MLQPWGRVEEEREKERRGKGEGLRDKECLVMLSGLPIPLQLPPPPSYSNSEWMLTLSREGGGGCETHLATYPLFNCNRRQNTLYTIKYRVPKGYQSWVGMATPSPQLF